MFDKLFKTKPYLIYLFTILVVLVIIYFGYPYLVKKDGFTANDDKDDDEDDEDDDDDEDKKEGFTSDDEDDNPVKNMRDSGMVNGDQAYKKNKISSIVPFPAPSSVGPTNPGVSVDDYVENFEDNTPSNNKNNVKTYNF